jgi:hypothetical protein
VRLGKEQAIGVIEEPAEVGGVLEDQLTESDAGEQRCLAEPAGDISPLSSLSEQGALIQAE